MTLTLTKKLFWGMTLLIMLFVVVSQFLNSQFLEDYYLAAKKEELHQIHQTIQGIYLGDPATITLELEKLERTMGVHIIIFDAQLKPKYRLQKLPQEFLSDSPKGLAPPVNKLPPPPDPENEHHFEKQLIEMHLKELQEGKQVNLLSKDPRIQTQLISLITGLGQYDFLVLNFPFASINESVRIANRFFLFTGLFTFLLGSIAIYLFAKRLTKPILVLNEIAQRMAQLDFSQKYQVASMDEVGQLGTSINSLSDQLHQAITGLTTANEKLLEDIEQERRIDEMRREFISNVSHELKTPIALIQGYAEGLKENVNEDEENKNFYCEVIADEAHKMGKLVRNLLDLSQMEAGNFQLDKSTFYINQLITEVLEKYKPLLLEKNIHCTRLTEPKLRVFADRFRTEQILTNYLNNAINHVDHQKVITLSLENRSNKAHIAVYNSGNHLAMENIHKVWENFYKVDKARTRAYGGTGLGLSIVRAIQEMDYNGYGVRNKDEGVEFWFELDLATHSSCILHRVFTQCS